MSNTTVTFSGWGEFIKKAQNLPQVLFEEIDGECEDAAAQWEDLAKVAAPRDQGFIGQNITSKQLGLMHYDVTSGSEISAIMEWGTGHRAKVPSELTQYASQFRGKPDGGTAAQAIKNLKGWVRRKNIRFESAGQYKSGKKKGQNKALSYETTAHIIFHFIMLHGVRPHPFFFVQKPIVEKQFIANIQNILNTEH